MVIPLTRAYEVTLFLSAATRAKLKVRAHSAEEAANLALKKLRLRGDQLYYASKIILVQ